MLNHFRERSGCDLHLCPENSCAVTKYQGSALNFVTFTVHG